jgi:arylsulfatase A-like enzyme
MMSKRNSISAPLVALAVFFLGAVSSIFAADTPNVVIILADDMGYGDVQALNPESKIPTPNLNQLARQGMTFTDGHSPSAVCTPTRYGLLTGRYCWRSRLQRGVLGGYSSPLLAPDRSTIATMLKSKGYHTGAVGKWHLGMELPRRTSNSDEVERWDGDPGIDFGGVITDSPIHHGFDDYFGVSASLDMAPYVYIRNDRFTMKPTLEQPAIKFPHFVRKGPRAEDFRIDKVLDRLTEEATAFLRKAAQGEQPFFLYLPLTAPHKPTQPAARFRGQTPLGEYGDFVAQVDWTVGQVLKALNESDVANNSLVVFTSDNGSYMYCYEDEREDHVSDSTVQGFRSANHRANGTLRGTKADVWEAGHRVPLFVRWPGEVQPGSTCSTTVCLTDLYATIAEIVGAELSAEEAEDSCSLVGMLDGTSTRRGAPVVNHSANGMFAIRDGRWKLVLGNGSGGRQAPRGKPFQKPYQLFDLDEDLSETKDVADQHPEIVQRLTDMLDDIRQRGHSVKR